MNKQPQMLLGPLIIDVEGLDLNADDKEVLQHPLIGGVILFTRNYENKQQVTQLVTQIKSLRTPELLVCVDQEGGRVQRFEEGFTELPRLHTLGCLYDEQPEQALDAAYNLARLMATELKPTGIDFSFAPVIDLFDPSSEIIANRAFHHDPQVITELAKFYIKGLHDSGMIAVGKHYPGHGGVLEDSHLCLPQDQRCYKDVADMDLIPYRQLINHDLDAVMTAHVLFNQIDTVPSGFSEFWLKTVLRQQLGFKGIIFTDDLSMQGAVELGSVVDRTHMALNAGADITLICNDRAAVEQVLSDDSLLSLMNPDAQLEQRCRKWQDNSVKVDSKQISKTLDCLQKFI